MRYAAAIALIALAVALFLFVAFNLIYPVLCEAGLSLEVIPRCAFPYATPV